MLRKVGRNRIQKSPLANISRRMQSRRPIEFLEGRMMLAAHISGSATVYPTIQAAVNAASPGATITVDPGNYAELVTVSKPLTIQGAQAGVDARSNLRPAASESIITGAKFADGSISSPFYIAANDVTIDGFTIQGNTNAGNYGAGVVIAPSEHGTHVLNNIIQNNVTGLYLSNNSSTDAAVIQHNLFLNNNNPGNNGGRGIYTDSGVSGGNLTNVLIDGNDIIVNHIPSGGAPYEGGIALEGRAANSQSNITITNNLMDGTGKLLIYNASNITIEYNTVTGQTDQWSGTLRFEGGVTNVTIKYNTVFDNRGPGVSIDSKGFPADDSGFTITNNNFFNNNTVYGNKLSLVVTAANYDGPLNAQNNWWGSATGPGGDGKGTGDTVYGDGDYYQGTSGQWSTLAGGINIAFSPWSTTPNAGEETAYKGVPASAGALIQAEDFDNGGNGVGYSTAATSNSGGQYRPAESVGIEATTDTGGGYNVGWTTAGQWLDYAVNLAQGGTYSVAFRVADAQTTGGQFHLNVDGQNVTGAITAPATGGWETWQTVTVNNINLTAGSHILRLMMDANGSSGSIANFNWLELIPVSTTTPPAAPTALAATVVSATTVNLAWQESSTNVTGFIIQRSTDGINFTQIGVANASAVSYVDTTAMAGVTYTYRVSATSAAGNSGYSNTAVVTTPAVATAPASLNAVAISSTQVNLTWTDTAAGIENGFLIQRSVDGVTFTQIGSTALGVTQYSDTTAAAGTTYTYRVEATSAGGTSSFSNTAITTTPAAGAISTALSSLNWTSATAGWGTVEKNATIASNTLTLHGVTYASGIGTHAASQIVYNLAGAYINFISDVGIDAEEYSKGTGSVDFQVIGDGKTLFDSGVLTNASPTVTLDVNVTGVNTLTLVATNGVANSIDYDHADWAGARLLSSALQMPTAPAAVVATAASASQVNLSWTNPALNATGFIVQRSTDGTTFTQIGTTAANVTNFSDTGLAAATTYTYRILATSAGGNSLPSTSVSATTLTATSTVTYVSDLAWTSATTGWGTVQNDASISGNTLTLRGTTYAKGIGTHALSQIVYTLNGAYTNFISDVGIDDEELLKGPGAVDFQVIGDGKVLFDSGVLTETSPIVSINVSVVGVQQLTLLATNAIAGNIDYDHADWAGARLLAAPTVTTASTTPIVTASVFTLVTQSTVVAPVTTSSITPAVTASDVTAPTPLVGASAPMTVIDGPALPAGWTNASVNVIGGAGSASETGGVFTVAGAGAGIGGHADSLNYAFQSLIGNGTVMARVTSIANPADEAGLMIRETLAGNAKQVSLVLNNKGVSFINRAKAGAVSATTTKSKVAAPQWLKLSRKGNTFTAWCSVDGIHWTKVGSTTVKMNASVNVGVAVTAPSPNEATGDTALFSNVSIVNG